MPIYEYRCDACGKVTEALQRVSAPPPGACPSCDGGPLQRILSAHNVGAVSSSFASPVCDDVPAPSCGECHRAGTGCS